MHTYIALFRAINAGCDTTPIAAQLVAAIGEQHGFELQVLLRR